MDLRALMQKLEIINNKQYLTESEEKEQTDKKECPPMSHIKKMCQDGKSVAEICKMHPDCDQKELKQMVADCKETLDNGKKKTNEGIVFKSSIAQSLAEEFGYSLDERVMPGDDPNINRLTGKPKTPAPNDPSGAEAQAQAAGKRMADAALAAPANTVQGGWTDGSGNPVRTSDGQQVASGSTPAAQKVAPDQADRDDAQQGADARAMAAGGNSTSAATGVGNPGEEAAAAQAAADKAAAIGAGQDGEMADMGAAMTANAAQADAIKSGAQDDVTGVDKAVAANAAAPATAPATTATPTAYKGNAGAQDIQKLNPAIKDVNKIQVGQKIKLPNGTEYTVKPGDTLDKIAKGGTSAPAAKPAAAPAAKPAAAPAPGRKDLDITTIAKPAATAAPAAAQSAPAKTFAQDTAARKSATPGLPAAPTRGGPMAPPATAAAPTRVPTAAPKLPAAGTTSTQSNQSVQGTMKMGKPDGPITFNGKQVQPGAPEYAAASAALIQAQGGARNFRSRNDQNVEKNLAASGAPVSAGAPNVDKSAYEESLSRMLSIAGLR